MLPRSFTKNLLQKPAYARLRYHPLVQRFWLWLRPDVRKDNHRREKLYSSILPYAKELIFDIGANEGMTTALFAEHTKQVIAVEPLPRNLQILNAKFEDNKRIKILGCAVSDSTGEQEFYEDAESDAMGTLNADWNEAKGNDKAIACKVPTTTLDKLVSDFGVPNYIKIDVEGHEKHVLQGLSVPVPLISFEAMLPKFLPETLACVEHLSRLQPKAIFNISLQETFLYKNFSGKEQLSRALQAINATVEVWCSM